MKKFFDKKVIIIILIALVIALSTAVTVTLNDTASGHIANAINTAVDPVKRGMASMVNSLEQLYGYLYKYDMLEQENEELRERVAELENEAKDYDTLTEENQQLRDLLDLGKRNKDFKFESVTVLSWSASNYNSSFTISKGENAGLELNDSVVTSSGYLVGRITELSPTTATVTTIVDSGASMGAMIYEVEEMAVAEGDFQMMLENRLKLTYINQNSQIMPGYTITTSGRSDLYPKGLVIGTVESVEKDQTGLVDFAVIKPSVNFEKLLTVYVVTDFDSD